MIAFAVLFMPLSLILWAVSRGEKKYFVSFLTGFLSGVVVCGFKGFFTFAHRIIPYSFMQNFIYLFFSELFLPVAILTTIFFLLSHDGFEFKAKSFFPLNAGFYCILLPYITLTGNKAIHTHFELFIKPVLFVSALFLIGGALMEMCSHLKNNKKVLAFTSLLPLIIALIAPALIESAYLIHMNTAIYILGSVLLAAMAIFQIVYKLIKTVKKNA